MHKKYGSQVLITAYFLEQKQKMKNFFNNSQHDYINDAVYIKINVILCSSSKVILCIMKEYLLNGNVADY